MSKNKPQKKICKVFTRDNSILIFQVWHKSETKLIKKWINWSAHTFILNSKNSLTEVYFDQKDLNINANRAIARRLQDRTFLPKLFNQYKEKLRILEKIWKQNKALESRKELIKLFNLAAEAWSGSALSYQIPIMPKGFATKEQIKEALKMRRESEDFFVSLDKIFIKSLKELFPKLGKFVKFITIEELEKNKIPHKTALEKRAKHFIFYQRKIFTVISFDDFLKKHNFKLIKETSKIKPKWLILQKRGEREHFPIMPAILPLFEAATDETMERAIGVKEKSLILEFRYDERHNYGIWFGREDQWDKICQNCYKILRKNPAAQDRIVQEYQKRAPTFLRFCRQVSDSNLKKKSNRELWQYYQKYIHLYKNLYIWAEFFGFAARDLLTKYLTTYLRKKLRNKKELQKFDQYFNTLITPQKKSFLTEERVHLLQITQKIVSKPRLKEIFQQKIDSIQKKVAQYPKMLKLIQQHTKKYHWIPYDYGGHTFGEKHFISELKKIMQNDSPEKELLKIQKKFSSLPKQKRKISRRFLIDKYHQELFRALAVNNFIIDYKKKTFTISHILINKSLIKEIARRLKIPQRHAHSILENEMKECLQNKCLPQKVLEKRFKHAVFWVQDGKSKIMIGKEAEAFMEKQSIGVATKKEIKIIRGQIANNGVVKATVKVITRPNQFKKMKKGDILVAHMTTPEFVPIIKKAAAIITDEGGITCHAAIISREFNIPCIIGTKIVTEALKDGDKVVVDANEGIVKILKKE